MSSSGQENQPVTGTQPTDIPPPETPARVGRRRALGILAALVLLVATVWLRSVDLDHVPGIHADETWEAAQVVMLMNGETPHLKTASLRLKLDPLHPLFVAPFAALVPGTFWSFRAGIALSGVTTVVLAGLLFGRHHRRLGFVLAALLAFSPPLLFFSRISYDASHIPLVAVLALYGAWRRRWGWFMLAAGLAVLVYPTGILLLPICLLPALAEVAVHRRLPVRRQVLAVGLGLGLAVTAALVFLLCRRVAWVWHGVAFTRLFAPAEWRAAGIGVFAMLAGLQVYDYMAGTVPALWRGLSLALGVTTWAGVTGWLVWTRWRQRDVQVLGTVVGLLIVAGGLILGMGAAVYRNEGRFALVLVVPMLYVLAEGIAALTEQRQRVARVLGWGTLALVLASGLWGWQRYFRQPFLTSGGVFAPMRAGPVDPKEAAFLWLLDDARDADNLTVVCEDYYTYWPFCYQGYYQPRFTFFSILDQGLRPAALARLLADGAYLVGTAGGQLDRALRQQFATEALDRRDFIDYGGHPVLFVCRLRGTRLPGAPATPPQALSTGSPCAPSA